MNTPHTLPSRSAQRGVVLISAILILVIASLLALSMFKGFGIQELIAGNMREKQRALQSAEAAEQNGEIWLTSLGNVLSNSVDCSTLGLTATSSAATAYVCQKPVALMDDALNVATVPWTVGGAEVGFSVAPSASVTVSTNGGADTYYQLPRFYIGLVSSSAVQALYRIDAWNYGGTKSTVAVVESNYTVTCTTCSLGL
jgi:type IV pilus assembly protein PilX